MALGERSKELRWSHVSRTNACADWLEARARGPLLGCLFEGEMRHLHAGTVKRTHSWVLGVGWRRTDARVKEADWRGC